MSENTNNQVTIDWQAPLEAVHEDTGRVVPVEAASFRPDCDGDYQLTSYVEPEKGGMYFHKSGRQSHVAKSTSGWRIRNRLEAPQEPLQRDLGVGSENPMSGDKTTSSGFWGDPIEVNNAKPDWLTDADSKTKLWWSDHPGTSSAVSTVGDLIWEQEGYPLSVIRLPASHPYYAVAAWNAAHPGEAPFEYWGGGEEAPGDWDGGDLLTLRGRWKALFQGVKLRWTHNQTVPEHYHADIIGYRRRVESSDHYVIQNNTVNFDPAPHLATYDPAREVVVEKRTAGDWDQWLRDKGYHASVPQIVLAMQDLGLIKPTPTKLQAFLAAHPAADRETAEWVMEWMGREG